MKEYLNRDVPVINQEDYPRSFNEVSPNRIAFCGDWHGNFNYFLKAINYCRKNGVDTMVQLGDFGFWLNGYGRVGMLSADGSGMLRSFRDGEGNLRSHDIDLVVIDGNHEDFRWLNAQQASPDGTVHLGNHIFYTPRGFRWNWSDVDFLSLGGAYSVDSQYRRDGYDWFEKEEVTSEAEVAKAIAGGDTDVLLTHDAPLEARIPLGKFPFGQKEYRLAQEHRAKLSKVWNATKPALNFHGHFHKRYTDTPKPGMQIEGLDMDGRPFEDNILIMDIEELKGIVDTNKALQNQKEN